MRSDISYVGISTKIRGMQRKLLSSEEIASLSECNSVREAAEKLSESEAYRGLAERAEGKSLHRSNVEKLLYFSLFDDFEKLYRFAGLRQRKFMDLYFKHFEVRILKICLENCMGGRGDILGLSKYAEILGRHLKTDVIKLAQSRDMAEFVENLKDTGYYPILKRIEESGKGTLLDYQTAIDMKYFNTMWKLKDKLLSKEDAKVIENTFGVNIDLLNINWIYRSKKYFGLSERELFNVLIPVRYKLTKENIIEMVKAPDMNAFFEAERKLRYSDMIRRLRKKDLGLTEIYDRLLTSCYRRESRKSPYSAASINTYFYLKEREIKNIVTALESIHYKLPLRAKEVKP